ncbi:MAG: SCO family protein [Burkholderiales bacterium]
MKIKMGPRFRGDDSSAWLAALALCLSFFSPLKVASHEADPLKSLDFTPPAPGSYQLQHIMTVPEGSVLDVDGETRSLRTFTRDKITLLSFIYTSCADPEGCPMAYQTFDDLKKHIVARPEFTDKIRFVSLSFDPLRDTPEMMQHYGGSHVRDNQGLQWFFLTTPSPTALEPLVEGFGQDVQRVVDKETGRTSQELSHVLKVFLIDRQGDVREIYTTSFLLPQVVMNDIETLLLERQSH